MSHRWGGRPSAGIYSLPIQARALIGILLFPSCPRSGPRRHSSYAKGERILPPLGSILFPSCGGRRMITSYALPIMPSAGHDWDPLVPIGTWIHGPPAFVLFQFRGAHPTTGTSILPVVTRARHNGERSSPGIVDPDRLMSCPIGVRYRTPPAFFFSRRSAGPRNALFTYETMERSSRSAKLKRYLPYE